MYVVATAQIPLSGPPLFPCPTFQNICSLLFYLARVHFRGELENIKNIYLGQYQPHPYYLNCISLMGGENLAKKFIDEFENT